ncbi:PHP domain-containing protein [Actinopolymorpha singaporensis]|uniref:Histidinol-phosphatase n=1 Tax=Actinopolymorpha singaporensis TaxID=117157 RepID=A0A1H1L7N6_9ACTN|nr:PHP domain-containing protein [Actinopolymorpha singaporensis]SDR70611.1 histidinol-phosphatase (PHP family) [Actinopolymorpha singaporensis]
MTLPADTHVHSEYSWDTGGPDSPAAGTMERTCARAARIGLSAVVFTEHLDFVGWQVDPTDLAGHLQRLVGPDQTLVPPPLEVDGYLESIERCRRSFRDLRILTGVEFGQPHLDEEVASHVLDVSKLDRVNGSLHTLVVDGRRHEPPTLYGMWPADKVIWEYLAEVPRMVDGSDAFEVLTHIDYAVRYWPREVNGPFEPRRFEDGFRQAMRALAGSGRALEMNVGGQLRPWIPQWWSEEGGRAITFGSDAHEPRALANNFPEAVAMVEHFGFRPGRRPADVWTR